MNAYAEPMPYATAPVVGVAALFVPPLAIGSTPVFTITEAIDDAVVWTVTPFWTTGTDSDPVNGPAVGSWRIVTCASAVPVVSSRR